MEKVIQRAKEGVKKPEISTSVGRLVTMPKTVGSIQTRKRINKLATSNSNREATRGHQQTAPKLGKVPNPGREDLLQENLNALCSDGLRVEGAMQEVTSTFGTLDCIIFGKQQKSFSSR